VDYLLNHNGVKWGIYQNLNGEWQVAQIQEIHLQSILEYKTEIQYLALLSHLQGA